MSQYEYKVVPAPLKGVKSKGLRTAEARFSHTLQELMNQMAAEGWEYQRAETLPSQERAGLTGTTTEWRNVLIFRRAAGADTPDFKPELLPAPEPEAGPDDAVAKSNDLEDTSEGYNVSASLSVLAAKRNVAKPSN